MTPLSSSSVDAEQTRNTVKCKCKCKYRIRWFYSKGAFLVLIWNLLIVAAVMSQIVLLNDMHSGLSPQVETVVDSVPFMILLVCAPLCGWLADARFGKYRVFKTGSVLCFSAVVMLCVLLLVVSNEQLSPVIVLIGPILYCLGLIGTAACLVTSLQQGLDQMPDASTANITSFISWFVCFIFAGVWVGVASFDLFPFCMDTVSSSDNDCTSFKQMFSLLPVLCMAIVLCSDFFLSPKWLIIEPKSPQSLKVIFRVLKFAAKHKAPVNRSALTYWEEDIPSRIDLGKSKYGGPFKTEQVEDVKTFFKLLVVSVPFVFILLSLNLLIGNPVTIFSHISPYNSVILHYFTYNDYWCMVIGTLVYEFVIYPFARNKLPSILKRIGAASFLIIVLNIVSLVLSVVSHYNSTVDPRVWHDIVLQVIKGLSSMVLLSSGFEFVCAQSPYSMRTLVIGYATFLLLFSALFGASLRSIFHMPCTGQYCSIIHNSITLSLAVIGFLLHCILARWYKMRVRDDIYSPHRVVEEVYDRYLSAQPQVEFD